MIRRVLIALTILGTAAALVILTQRWSIERANRTVELTVEWPELHQLSAIYRVPLPRLLQDFHTAGVTSVAIQEQNVQQLVDDGQVFRPDPFTDAQVRSMIGLTPDNPRTVLAFPDPALEKRVQQNLSARWGPDRVHVAAFGAMSALIVDGPYAEFRNISVGLDPKAIHQARTAGFAIVARVKNYSGLTREKLAWTIKDLKSDHAHAVIFSGDEMLGNPDLIHDTADILREESIAYGSVEFGKQHGDEKLDRALNGEFLRVHTIQGAELSSLTPDAAIDRFVKAVRERTMRLLYIHVLSSVTGTTAEQDEAFIHRIAAGIEAAGYQTGQAEPMNVWQASSALQILVAVGLTAAAGWLALEIVGSLPPGLIVCLGLFLVALIGGIHRHMVLAEQAGAFTASLIFPTLALVLARFDLDGSGSADRITGHAAATRMAALRFLATSLMSLVGAVYVIGFLASTLFMTKTDQFAGIKGSIIIPVLVVFALYWGRVLDPGGSKERLARIRTRVLTTLGEPLYAWHLVALGIALVAFVVLVARSGNDGGVGATMLELKSRKILDGWLIARPRTKEFLIGNPALYLAFYAALRGWRRPLLALIVLGSIGQTSIVNTFCHIHTPIYIALFHAVNGLWLGALIGWLLSIIWDRVHQRMRRNTRSRALL